MLFEREDLKLCGVRGSYLIFTNDIPKWKQDAIKGIDICRKADSYEQIIIAVNSFEIDQIEFFGDYLEGEKKVILKRNNSNRAVTFGDSISDLYSMIKECKFEYKLFAPIDCVKEERKDDLHLCYVDGGSAFFTNNNAIWGDGWNDLGYEIKSCRPHKDIGYELKEIKYYSFDKYLEPCEFFEGISLSVQQINNKICPWLIPTDLELSPIFAGVSLSIFCKKIKEIGGTILVEVGNLE